MKNLTEKEKKRFTALLINSRMIYWNICHEKNYNYIGDLYKRLSFGLPKNRIKFLPDIKEFIISHRMTNIDIENFINTMENPREEWMNAMRKHNNGGKETRDNKGQFVDETTYQKPRRYENGNIEMCKFNKIRYPKKCRSLRTWKMFYKMFPKQAELDNWDGKTSDKMK